MSNAETPLHDPNPHASDPFPVLVVKHEAGRTSVSRQSLGRLHWHADLQFMIVRAGSLELHCSGAHVALSEGQGAFLNAGTPHRITPHEGCAYASLLFPPKLLGFFVGSEMALQCVEPYVGAAGEPCRVLDGSDSWHRDVLRELDLACSLLGDARSPQDRYHACAVIACVWAAYVGNVEPPKVDRSQALASDRLRATAAYIDAHYHEHIGLANIAAAAGVSKAECGRVFRRTLQTTPYAYLTEVRVARAAELLREGELSVTEIALSTGFGSASHFSNAFRKVMGTTPSAYAADGLSPA